MVAKICASIVRNDSTCASLITGGNISRNVPGTSGEGAFAPATDAAAGAVGAAAGAVGEEAGAVDISKRRALRAPPKGRHP